MSFDFSPVKERMQKAIEHFQRDIASLRTGKATVQILDPVVVEAYGSRMKITELGSVQAPDPTTLVISPWDKSVLANIERAIASAELNLNPVVDGDIIRIKIAPLTEEKRKEMVKVLHKKVEGGKVMMRNLRSDAKRDIESRKGTDGVSEDDIKSDVQSLDELLKEYTTKVDEIAIIKEKDLLTI